MHELTIEMLKQLNLAAFLSRHYGLSFRQRGGTYQCRSPFTDEKNPSFFVRLVEGHWLFKDYSSGAGGSIFDFVQMKEKLASFAEALAVVRKRVGGEVFCTGEKELREGAAAHEQSASRGYDVEELYSRFRQENSGVCRDYLVGRGISPPLVDALIGDQTVVHNRYQGRSYCCFAVRDDAGRLKCLDNHAVAGSEKFILGVKSPFSCEWEEVKRAKEVFLCEGIIDYLSVKSLEYSPPPGLALLGNQLCFDQPLLERAETLVSAMDDDRGGNSAVLDLKERYPEKDVRIYDLEGRKDPNELLMAARSGKGRRLSPERKLQLYREFQTSTNKAELARRWGMDRSHVYEIVRECERMVLEGFSDRRPGRPPKGKPRTLTEALERIAELEKVYERKATEQEEELCRAEFLAIRLKWAEIEAAQLRGEAVDDQKGRPKRPQTKKKRSKRRWEK
jgi:DNA primase